jgi:hypothetical protein
MNVQNDADRLVDDYLRRLGKEADPLPEGRRTELVAEVTAHIAEARAEGAVSESEVREMLARLGTPEEIVLAATDGLVLVDRQPRFRSREVAALLLLTVGGFVFLFGWVIGVVLLWTSDRWTRNEKWLGTLIWPFGFGLLAFLLNVYVPIDIPLLVVWPIWTLMLVAQIATTVMLIKNARPRRG